LKNKIILVANTHIKIENKTHIMETIKPFGSKCKRCEERTAHTLECCEMPLCCSCQHNMESTFHPFVYCPWCGAEILPFEVSNAKRIQLEMPEKLIELLKRLQDANDIIQKFEQERTNTLLTKRNSRRVAPKSQSLKKNKKKFF